MGLPEGLEEETRKKLESSIKGDRELGDVRFLMVELQTSGRIGASHDCAVLGERRG